MGVQGQDFKPELLGKGVKPSKGLRQAKLTPRTKALLEEVALSEQVRGRGCSCWHRGLRVLQLMQRRLLGLSATACAQGHALYTRQAGATLACPVVDYDAGFNAVFARAYGLKDGETISKLFGKDWGGSAGSHLLRSAPLPGPLACC